jgi:hypothetical protein
MEENPYRSPENAGHSSEARSWRHDIRPALAWSAIAFMLGLLGTLQLPMEYHGLFGLIACVVAAAIAFLSRLGWGYFRR